ncbi:MAG: hypothetical protein NVS1B7_1060 [Candidatus Saccharimonadales bacterium]
MNKRHLHHVWRIIRRLSYVYFLVVFIISSVIFIFAYRANNVTAIKLRDQLLSADKQGAQVEESLARLRIFTYGHMNANLVGGSNSIYPPIQLQGTYQRLIASEQKRVNDANAQTSVEAQANCNQQFPGAKTGYLLCVQNYEASHAATAQAIPDGLYKFDFISPRWSPDAAGWSLVVAMLAFTTFIIRLGLDAWLRYILKHHD